MRTVPTKNTAWWQSPLVREIALILVLKFALIFGLWWAFFDLPDDQHIDVSQVGAHVLGAPVPAAGIHEEILQ